MLARTLRAACALSVAAFLASAARAATYDVGPGQPLAAIGDVPWETLGAGDVVRIHWRAAPYREKFVITAQGTAAQPVRITGVRGPGGERPVISGDGATTRPQLDFWSETRGVVKVGGSSVPADVMPRWIVIEGLEIRSARDAYSFTDDAGNAQAYQANASAIYVEKCENLVVRDCVLHDCGNGFFVASTPAEASRDVLVDGCRIFDNGNAGSIYEHNNYTAAIGITFQRNWFGPPRAGSGGNNLKDRSAGLVVRYNWIEGGNRQLDLVDAEDSTLIRDHPSYRDTWVYGNVLVERDADGNRQVVHYGGDSGTTADYRKGRLHFFHNTVVSLRTDRTTLFRLSTNDETCDARDNVAWTSAAAGTSLALVDADGVLDWSTNLTKPGWRATFGTLTGTIVDDGTTVTAADAGFADEAGQDYRLAAGSPALDRARDLEPAAIPDHVPVLQYRRHQASDPRPVAGVRDIGAFELASAVPPVAAFDATPLAGFAPLEVAFTDRSTGSPTSWAWDFEDDGVDDATDPSPVHRYDLPGTYSVQLAVANAAGDDVVSRISLVCVAAPFPPNAPVGPLRVARDGRLTWPVLPGAAAWDVARGRLAELASAGVGGSFESCFAQRVPGPSVVDASSPPPGGWWYIVRARPGCDLAPGTWDSGAASQSGSRDAPLDAACP